MPDSPELAAYKDAAQESVNTWLTEWCLLFKAHDITMVTMSYSGGGDDGQINDVTFHKGIGKQCKSFEPNIPKTTIDKFERFLYDLIEARGANFNDEGSQGSLTWDIAADTLEHTHGVNYTEVKEEHYEGFADIESLGVRNPA